MLDFVTVSDETINIQVSGNTPEEALENIVIRIKESEIDTLSIAERLEIQAYQRDNKLYLIRRYELLATTSKPEIPAFVFDPDNLVG